MRKDREVPIRIVVRKKGHGGGHHGGAWKVAFADFMTGMFSLFLVLWLINQSSDIKSAIAGYFQDPLGRAHEYGSSMVPGEGGQPSRVQPLRQADVMDMRRKEMILLAERIQERLEDVPELSTVRGYIEIRMTEDGLQIELMEDSSGVFFEIGRPVPSSRGEQILGLLGAELGTLPYKVRIQGHTDAYPYRGDGSYTNWELSADRANTARRILTKQGLRPGQIAQVVGLADQHPRDEDPYAARNRRITIMMLLRGDEPGEEGKESLPRLPRVAPR